MEGYLGRDDTNRHKWRLRHALGDGFQPFEPLREVRTLESPPYPGGWEGVNKMSTRLLTASSAVEPLRGTKKEGSPLSDDPLSVVE